ncbi:MAG TPA: hypothetical protein VNW95_14635 [Mucilaginibacter sp.]|jgi:hypothetical protein|nr:hypothetical protein [Mucilaginibacter sp.]
MKKAICMIALAAISLGSIYAYGVPAIKASAQQDTMKKKRTKPVRRDTIRKKDTMFKRKKDTVK